jgi:hypothetical protein
MPTASIPITELSMLFEVNSGEAIVAVFIVRISYLKMGMGSMII